MGLAHDESTRIVPLTGGVASDIVRVVTGERSVIVKRALGRLRVAADWRVSTARNAYEVAWLREAAAIVPGAAPAVLGDDRGGGSFAMEWLPPDDYPVWKEELRQGRADPAFAARLGAVLAHLHARTAHRPELAARFDSGPIFHAIRLEPYFEATARRHPNVADRLLALSADTLATRVALVHGDVSPKNILCGRRGPVLLDAECAWYGEPAFDLAFCLNHLLLKCLLRPGSAAAFLACFTSLREAYFGVALGTPEASAARLLPALLLARVDGKSPVEYVTDESDRALVRAVALPLIAQPPATLESVRAAWSVALGRAGA